MDEMEFTEAESNMNDLVSGTLLQALSLFKFRVPFTTTLSLLMV